MNIVDIEKFTRFLTRTDTTSLTAAELLILENKYYEEITGRIISETAGAKWQYGDSNYSAFPDYTEDLVNSQAEYDIGAFGSDADEIPLLIMGVEILDVNGNYQPITPITLQQIRETGIGQSEFFKADGKPQRYEKRENFLVLYPAPDNGVTVTLTSGLKIFYLRRADIFTSAEVSTGTKVPGFPTPWHDLLSWGPAYDYSLSIDKPNDRFRFEYDKRFKEMMAFISRRDQDSSPVIRPRRSTYR